MDGIKTTHPTRDKILEPNLGIDQWLPFGHKDETEICIRR